MCLPNALVILLPKRNECLCSLENMHKNVSISVTHKGPKGGKYSNVHPGEWMNKFKYSHTMKCRTAT